MSRRTSRLPGGALGMAAALVLAGCSADPLNVIILNARAPGDKCDFSDPTLYVEGGSQDFRNGYTSFFQAFSWENQMLPLPISVNGQVVDPGAGNDFIGDTIVYSYQYTDPNVVLSPETQNIRASITAGGLPDKNFMGAQLIQPRAAAALDATLTSTPQTLLVTFQMFGKTVAGAGKNTNKVSFPLTVYKSAPTALTCTTGFIVSGGPCGIPGRGAPVQCIPSS